VLPLNVSFLSKLTLFSDTDERISGLALFHLSRKLA
jgi:hypothetical protein